MEDIMDTEKLVRIPEISEIASARSVSESKVKDTKKAVASGRMCTYFKDMICRIPLCDMDTCAKCSEGAAFCTRVNYIKSMLQKVLMFIIAIICISEI
jgi:hypothetical protein